MIAYRSNFVVIMRRTFRTFHDQCPVHIRVLKIFTGILRVYGCRRFRATTFCFLTVVFSVVVALLGASLSSLPFAETSPPPLPLYPMNVLHCSRSRKYLCISVAVSYFLLRGSLPKSVPLDFGLDKAFALYFYHQYYYKS